MAVVVIVPVEIKTNGGLTAKVTGIDPTDHDCLKGIIISPSNPDIDAQWDTGGLCRNQNNNANLDINDSDVADLVTTAKKLGAT